MINLGTDIQAVYESLEQVEGLSTGCEPLDKLTCGVYNGELVLLSGRPGAGKTSLMEDCLLAISKTHTPLAFSMEMGEVMVAGRLLAKEAQVNFQRLLNGTLSSVESEQVAHALQTIDGRNILIEGRSDCTVQAIETALNELDGKPAIIFIDHLQSMYIPGAHLSPYEEKTRLSAMLKAIAIKYNLPVVLLCHLNRGPQHRFNETYFQTRDIGKALEAAKPCVTDLRETGALEQDADQIWFLHRDAQYLSNAGIHNAEIIVAKRRNGPTGAVKLYWNPSLMSFKEPDAVF